MGWIIFVFVVLIVVSSVRRRTTKTRARMGQQLAVLQSQAHQATQTSQASYSAQVMPGQQPPQMPTTGRLAKAMPALQAALAGRMPVGVATVLQPNSPGTLPPGNSPTYQPGDSRPYQPGDAEVPVVPVRTAAHVQRPAPRQKRYQGSTAVSGSSLSSTLFSPYQPSSLVSSLSSSLSSSLTDSPPRAGATSAFSGVEVIALPSEVADRVRFHLRNGHEVEAVRLVCETMDVGLLEATKTVRSYA